MGSLTEEMLVKVISRLVPLSGSSADWAVSGAHSSPAQVLLGNPAGALAADDGNDKGSQHSADCAE